jgi:rod shape-determining protein MreD
MPASGLVAVPVMALLTIVQTAVFPRLPILGVTPSLPFLVALAWSVLRGLDEGLVWAFVAGLFMDLFTIAPVGGSSLTYMIAIGAATLLNDLLPTNRFIIPILLGAVASVIQILLYTGYLRLFGYATGFSMAALLPQVAVQTAVFLPVYWLFYFSGRLLRPSPVSL